MIDSKCVKQCVTELKRHFISPERGSVSEETVLSFKLNVRDSERKSKMRRKSHNHLIELAVSHAGSYTFSFPFW